jgi:GT2 family glycosyltransferase
VSGERVFRNDWSRLSPPAIGAWTPTRPVSVVMPVHNGQDLLNLTLASLSRQTYPAHLLEVVVVDDGSQPPLTLPELRPELCRILHVTEGWGRSNALHTGAAHSDGEILHWLDADMVVFPEHVEAQARWHHVSDDAVTLGYKRFVNEGTLTAEDVVKRAGDGTLDRAFPAEVTAPHDYVEELIDKTNQLRGGDHLNFRAHVGATAALTRGLYLATGGLNPNLHLGEDTEFGYRLTQAGAVFIPEPAARSWHMGPTNMMRTGEALRRYNQPFLAELMPHPRWLRPGAQRTWLVPLVTAVVEASGSLEQVRTCVDRLLASDEHDLAVVLVGPWETLHDERRRILADPQLDLRLTQATYQGEPRVRLATAAPATVFPSPYRLNLPTTVGVGLSTVRKLVAEADRWKVGLVRARATKSTDATVELWRTAAVSRAVRTAGPDESLVDGVAAVYGQRWVSAEDFGLLDLSTAKLVSPAPRLSSGTGESMPMPREDGEDYIIVGGLRSWARATRMVARQGFRHIRTR